MAFQRLIRFVDTDGNTWFGDAKAAQSVGAGDEVEILEGNIGRGFTRIEQRRRIQKVVFPL